MIELDLAYPGLQRVSLAHNYRCPPEIVAASRAADRPQRDPLPEARSSPRPAAPRRRARSSCSSRRRRPPARRASRDALARSPRGEIVVLARTTNLLRTVALACADARRRGSARREAVFEPRGARLALEAYLRLCGAPAEARAEDVAHGLPRAQPRAALSRPRRRSPRCCATGFSFSESFAGARGRHRQRLRLDERRRRARRAGGDHRRAPVHRLPARRGRPRRLLRRARGGVRRDRADRARGARAGEAEAAGQDRRAPTARCSRRAPTRCARSATTSTGSS